MSEKKVTSIRFDEKVIKDIDAILKHKNDKYPYYTWRTRTDLIEYFVINGINRYKRNNDLK